MKQPTRMTMTTDPRRPEGAVTEAPYDFDVGKNEAAYDQQIKGLVRVPN
jgi:hypothetical protein